MQAGPVVLIVTSVIGAAQPIALAAEGSAARAATRLLRQVPLPSTARQISHLKPQMLHHPASSMACTPLVDKTRLLVVDGTVASVSTFLKDHHPVRWILEGTGDSYGGRSGEVSSSVTYFPVATPSPRQLIDVTYAEVGPGKVGLRVDAEVVPGTARCSSTGVAVPAPVMNVR
jgi:hypothetical protein